MQLRNVGQWICVLAIGWATGSAVVSCGGSGSGSTFADGGAGASSDSSLGGDGPVATNDGPSFFGSDGASDGGDGGGNGNCKTCAQMGFDCGMNVNNCMQPIDCGSCPTGQSCGNGGFSTCGATFPTADGGDAGSLCVPGTTCPAGQNCGVESDGCGGVINCGGGGDGGVCPLPSYCGGGGFNICGGNSGLGPDGAPTCTPKTACDAGMNCGQQGDGCGGSINCGAGACPSPTFCGGAGPNICGGNSGLGPDGGSTLCVPKTCSSQGFDCGPAGDGCGNLIPSCGTCTAPNICGGAGVPGSCGNSACTGLCLQQTTCSAGLQTSISGKVIAGTIAMFGTPDPVPNVIVYVPNAPLQPFSAGVQCSQCGAEVTGSPLVQTTTAFDGTFTLTNVPAGTNIPVVIQLGRWRRTFSFTVPSCTASPTSVGNLQMPQNQGQGDIPFTAISTGKVDTIECVLLKMGVDQAEFTPQGGGGRVNLYIGNGVTAGAGTTQETALMGAPATKTAPAVPGSYMDYDQILFPCWGSEVIKTATELANLVTYGNGGGHFFATHYSYTWLFQNNPYNTTANWDVNFNDSNNGAPVSSTVEVPPTNPKGTIFTEWLELVGAMPTPPNVAITFPRHDVDTVAGQSVNWISTTDPTGTTASNKQWLMHYTFDTPVGAATQCGHSIFSDFHVANASVSDTTTFPAECLKNETTGATCTTAAPCPMTAQEKILEYMIWDLASCVPGPPTPPTCTPISCAAQSISCGPAGDGCGNELDCGPCTPPQTCGGGGTPGVCGAPDGGSCTPETCSDQGISCGPAGDGCGNLIQCGPCTPPQTCGGGGTPGVCGYPDASTCQPQSCAMQGIFCGPAGDGCGNEIQCGVCTAPMTCGGGGQAGVCGEPDASTCMPVSCATQGIQCGMTGDGCGNTLECPACPPGDNCVSGRCESTQ